uniref:Putative neurotoxin-D n=1 Tax=Lychas mucronatus TaxID=172552 RepID=KTXD_LYCMC|nr:RecName: Full=Putative neurotoxin-D; Flags: Precursor [Lychas mucronatus]
MRTTVAILLVLFALSAILAFYPDTTAEAKGCVKKVDCVCKGKGKKNHRSMCINGKCYCLKG